MFTVIMSVATDTDTKITPKWNEEWRARGDDTALLPHARSSINMYVITLVRVSFIQSSQYASKPVLLGPEINMYFRWMN